MLTAGLLSEWKQFGVEVLKLMQKEREKSI
jgi:hypothetical protein